MRLIGSIARKAEKAQGSVHFTVGQHKVPRVWIIIADKHMAKIFSKAGNSIEMIGEAWPSENKQEDMKDKNTGRIMSPSGKILHIEYEPAMSPIRRKAFRFAHEIADWLDNSLQKDAFDRLILVAPPQTLGDLRAAINKPVLSRLVAEINKDMTKLNENDLGESMNKLALF